MTCKVVLSQLMFWTNLVKVCNSSIVRRGWFYIEIRRGWFSTGNTNDTTLSLRLQNCLSLQRRTSDVIAQFYTTFINSLRFSIYHHECLSSTSLAPFHQPSFRVFLSALHQFIIRIASGHTSSVKRSFHLVGPTSFQFWLNFFKPFCRIRVLLLAVKFLFPSHMDEPRKIMGFSSNCVIAEDCRQCYQVYLYNAFQNIKVSECPCITSRSNTRNVSRF
jgi:hypothetical protein